MAAKANATAYRDFGTAFKSLTRGHNPYSWQQSLARRTECRSMMIHIPTGLGKTEGIMAAWAWNRLLRDGGNEQWPRRLVWCLPMRVLVEQTLAVAQKMIEQLPADCRPVVAPIMGGEDAGEWFLQPEKPSILIGTQDMLLSRALNRGYGSGRARWPMEYGLLHHDALWVMDEIQLMDVGLVTSAQLQAYRDQDQAKGFRPCHTWWMSATLQPDWLKTVDTEVQLTKWALKPVAMSKQEQTGGLWEIKKELQTAEIGIKTQDIAAFAKCILDKHRQIQVAAYGRITLVVCNTVARACETYDALVKDGRTDGIKLILIHSRFRPHERQDWQKRFLNRAACEDKNANRIIVATQVVEAGVDISAGCLVTELAPWPSLVQRFGRCARYGGDGRVVVVDRGLDKTTALPYALEELKGAWNALQEITDVDIAALQQYEESINTATRQKLYPYNPEHLLLRREFDELFDTTADLTGADLDISRFIRSGDERDLQVFWRRLVKDLSPAKEVQPRRDELCSVPFLKARDWLCGTETKTSRKPRLRSGMRAWVWDWLDGEWKNVKRDSLLPGRIVCVAADCGGYTPARGFAPDSKGAVELVPDAIPDHSASKTDLADAHHDGEELSVSQWKTITCHSREVMDAVAEIALSVGLPQNLTDLLKLAAQWHDLGKAHYAFQGCIKKNHVGKPDRDDLAKAPDSAWVSPRDRYPCPDGSDRHRPGFRHELVSALALFAVLERHTPQHPALLGPWSEVLQTINGRVATPRPRDAIKPTPLEQAVLDLSAEDFDLLIYLVASHHGKVRMALHAAPKDQDYVDRDERGLPIRGVREGDRIPAVNLDDKAIPLPELALTLEPAKLGLSPRTGASWRERTLGLIDQYGPAALAYLEALLRAADVRASRLKTADPALPTEAAK